MSKTLLLLLLSLLLLSCGNSNTETAFSDKPYILCTTGMVADLAKDIAGDYAEVEALMGPGVDPHLYKATQGDLKKMRRADLILYNGHHLEGKMAEVLTGMDDIGTTSTLALAETIAHSELIQTDEAGNVDPHIWFDVALWSSVINPLEQSLSELLPSYSTSLKTNATNKKEQLRKLDEWVRMKLGQIPEEHRLLITAHDAFEYFGRAYGLEVQGLQGISTMAEAGLKDVTDLVDLIIERQIPAIFVESSVPKRDIEAVVAACRAKGHEVSIGGTLYSDALGAADSPEGSYEGMVRYNVEQISAALR